MGERLQRLSGAAARRPALTLAVVLVLALAGGAAALGLRPAAGADTFVSRSSPAYRATADDERRFGDDAVIVLVHEPLSRLVRGADLATLTRLEACLAGQYVVRSARLRAYVPAAHAPYGGWAGPCGKLMRHRPAQVVYGPGTFLNRAVAAVNTQIATALAGAASATRTAEATAYALAIGRGLSRAAALTEARDAGQLESGRQLQALEQLYVSSGINGTPSIDNPQFISQIVFDRAGGADQPKSRFAYLFPNAGSAIIQVRLRSALSDAQQAQAIAWIREAVRLPAFRSPGGATYTVTGLPVVVDDLAGEITGAIAGLLIAALAVMAIALLIVFRTRLRLLPLAVAVAAAGITFGLPALAGATLTMASIAVLPIVIGLGVDYGIQFQARTQEAAASAGGRLTAPEAVAVAARRAVPTIATAALATATGFLVLLLSPVPMVRGFGLLLVAGIAVALLCSLTAGSAALVLADRRPGRARGALGASVRGAGEIVAPGLRRAAQIVAPGLRGAAEIVGRGLRGAAGIAAASLRGAAELIPGGGRLERPARPAGALDRMLAAVTRHPGRVLALAAVLAVAGWIADTQLTVQSDVTKLVPSTMPALRDLRRLERVTGVSGEIDVTVRGSDVATPRTVSWMTAYESALLGHYGYVEQRGCAHATLCPALSLPDLFATQSGALPAGDGTALGQAQITALLRAVPAYFSQAVITPDHREATLAFGIRLMPLARQQVVIDYMRSHLHPPPGVRAALAGLPVLAAQANAALSSAPRRLLTLLAGLLAVGLMLALVLRRPGRVLAPMIPIVLATGWSSLVVFLIGIPLNPMSATLGTLVIAISTEFSVLLSERCAQERAAGHDPAEALARTYRSTGAAVLASGITAIAGFGVLVFSDITMLRDFGFVTLVDLTVSLGGVMVILPAVLALGERGDARARAAGPWRAASAAIGRVRRGPRV
ncbi:MAG: MMPL family transporter, partial [Solirubrobacteraceae bacterium]